MRDIGAIGRSGAPDLLKSAQKHKVHRRLTPYRIGQWRLHLDAVYIEAGDSPESPREVGKELARALAPVFPANEHSTEDNQGFDANTETGPDFGEWAWRACQVQEVARRMRKSAPDPDDLQYQV